LQLEFPLYVNKSLVKLSINLTREKFQILLFFPLLVNCALLRVWWVVFSQLG